MGTAELLKQKQILCDKKLKGRFLIKNLSKWC